MINYITNKYNVELVMVCVSLVDRARGWRGAPPKPCIHREEQTRYSVLFYVTEELQRARVYTIALYSSNERIWLF